MEKVLFGISISRAKGGFVIVNHTCVNAHHQRGFWNIMKGARSIYTTTDDSFEERAEEPWPVLSQVRKKPRGPLTTALAAPARLSTAIDPCHCVY